MTGRNEKGRTRSRTCNLSPWRGCRGGIGAGPSHAAKTPPPKRRASSSLPSDRVDQGRFGVDVQGLADPSVPARSRHRTHQPRHAARLPAALESRLVCTVAQRGALRQHLLRLAEADARLVAAAAVGSLAADGGDRFSDLDLSFGIAEHLPVAAVRTAWTRTLIDQLDAVHLADLERGPTSYRVLRFPHALQVDLSMTPAAQFRPAGPRFRLLFGQTAAGEPEGATPPVAGDLFGGVSSMRSTPARASNAGVSGRRSSTSARCAATRSRFLPRPGAAGGAGARL
jgi:hypothetical protein